MPKNIKKFKLTYQQVPEVFALPKKMYLQDEAETIPEETLEQTEAQKTLIAETVTTLNKDSDRTCYVDFAGRKVSQLKADWLVCNAAGKLELAKEVYPDYTQGNNTGASVGENLYSFQFYIPMSISNPTSCGQIKRQAICFAYRNAAGEPAGFSLMASGNASEYQDWIISTIQNTTAHPKKRVVTVLSTPGIVTSKAKASVLMDNPTTIQMELKEAIKNDTVSRLIEGIFNPDGSLNSDYINSLDSRITPDLNIDDRDRKESRLSTLFELSNTVNQSELNDYIASVKEQISIDINFFENIVFENHLNTTLNRLAVALSQRPGTTKTVEEITTTLEKISECSAHFEQLAECSHRNPEQVNTYKALAEKIRSNAALLRFNGTKVDDKKIAQITQLDVSQVEKTVLHYYKSNLDVKEYYKNKDTANQEMQKKLCELPNPSKEGFFSRNKPSLILGLIVAIGIALSVLFAPFSIALIAIGVAALTVIAGITLGTAIYKNMSYSDELSSIRSVHKNQSIQNEQNLQKGINVSSLLIIDKPDFLSKNGSKRKPLTPENVAHDLWLKHKDHKTTALSKNRFSLWAKQQNLPFGINEVESVIEDRYEMDEVNSSPLNPNCPSD